MNVINIEKISYFYLCNETSKVFKNIKDARKSFIRGSFDSKVFIIICQGYFKYFENTFLGDVYFEKVRECLIEVHSKKNEKVEKQTM